MCAQANNLLNVLWGKENLTSVINFDSLQIYQKSALGDDVKGELNFSPTPLGIGITPIFDESGIHNSKNFYTFPLEKLTFSSSGGVVVTDQAFFETTHEFFNIYFGSGYSRKIENSSASLVVMPFSLIHKNANCTHNGIFIFAYNDNTTSNAVAQISSETCAYYKFDYVSVFGTTFSKQDINFENNFYNYHAWNKTVADTAPILKLYSSYDIESPSFADNRDFIPANVSLYGLIDGDAHYSSECTTRAGMYPFCDQLLLPSYSLAKSIAGTLSVWLIEQQHEDFSKKKVSDVLEECNSNRWKDVTVENLSDMATGNYYQKTHDLDERSSKHLEFIYSATTNQAKLNLACTMFPKRKSPGKEFVYHTSDTYILGAVLSEFIGTDGENYFEKVLAPFFKELGLSEAAQYSLTTDDAASQPYTGWGMFFVRDDIFKLSNFLHQKKMSDQSSFLHDALNPDDTNSYSAIPSANIFYNNGFWSRKYEKGEFGCSSETWIPFMSGFGGITVALLPNNMTYYYFSDGYTYSWDKAVRAANRIKPFCKEKI